MTDSNSSPKSSKPESNDNPAVSLVREKLGDIYGQEPSAKEEVKEISSMERPLSKHQAYMQKISQSGMSLADIQTAWHKYYVSLPDNEKHEVWKEFYAEHDRKRQSPATKPAVLAQEIRQNGEKPTVHSMPKSESHRPRSASEVKRQLVGKANLSASNRTRAKQHFQSLLFGVGMGLIAVIILLFGFFNDRFIAPFITPSRNVSSTPIILDASADVSSEPKIIIPKINVEIPVVYDEPSIQEAAVQKALERGVVHYATTPSPGEKGNAVIFGHSSNNILNKGKYKFAFVLLSRLEEGDTFYLNKDGIRYAYKIYSKQIVKPTEVDVLNSNDKAATVTLITCDPPGTTRNRLVVVGEQISPKPSKNVASTAKPVDAETTVLAGNAPSLWQRIKDWF